VQYTPGLERQAILPSLRILESAVTHILHKNALNYVISRLKYKRNSEEGLSLLPSLDSTPVAPEICEDVKCLHKTANQRLSVYCN